MITLADINEAYKNASKPEKQEFINMILPDLKESPIFKFAVETAIATSELGILPRLTQVEMATGKYDFEDFEDHEPTIPEQITELKHSIKTADFCLNLKEPINIIPETKTGRIAFYIKDYLENDLTERNGQYSLNGNEIKDMIVRTIPEKFPDLAPKKGQNIRKLKKDVLGKLMDILGSRVKIDKNEHGRHETRILFKPLLTVTS